MPTRLDNLSESGYFPFPNSIIFQVSMQNWQMRMKINTKHWGQDSTRKLSIFKNKAHHLLFKLLELYITLFKSPLKLKKIFMVAAQFWNVKKTAGLVIKRNQIWCFFVNNYSINKSEFFYISRLQLILSEILVTNSKLNLFNLYLQAVKVRSDKDSFFTNYDEIDHLNEANIIIL